jgi:glycosyltransferase involved in cell wall biosynthesis
MKSIFETPEIFLTRTNHHYPPGNNIVFEHFFLEKFISENPDVNRIYLPIQWTCFYISRNYGNSDMLDLQIFLDSLPRDKKYFTIVQWDDGILNKLDGLDILKFSSGGVGDYPIPLINVPHNKINRDKDIFASFVGAISGRHKIRERINELLSQKDGFFISQSNGFNNFKEIMERSIFSLCPRGYGKTSFRINESLNLGSIPVYIYDEPWVPFYNLIDFKEYGVLIHENEIDNIEKILRSYSQDDINRMRYTGEKAYEEFYTYESCFNKIIEILKNEK